MWAYEESSYLQNMCDFKYSLFTTGDVELPLAHALVFQMLSHLWGGFQTLPL